MSIDTACCSCLGFLFYSIYNFVFFFRRREEYYYNNVYKFHDVIEIGDLVFSSHAVIALLYIIFQCIWFDGSKQIPQAFTLALISMSSLFSIIYLLAIFCISGNEPPFLLDDWLHGISIAAVTLELIRLLPQCLVNSEYKIFVGIDLGTMGLELIGGISCVLQIILDEYDLFGASNILDGIRGILTYVDNFNYIENAYSRHVLLTSSGNLAKFCLGIVTIICCLALFLQYLYYSHRNITAIPLDSSSHSSNAPLCGAQSTTFGSKDEGAKSFHGVWEENVSNKETKDDYHSSMFCVPSCTSLQSRRPRKMPSFFGITKEHSLNNDEQVESTDDDCEEVVFSSVTDDPNIENYEEKKEKNYIAVTGPFHIIKETNNAENKLLVIQDDPQNSQIILSIQCDENAPLDDCESNHFAVHKSAEIKISHVQDSL